MSKNITPISTLEFYNYGENNRMDSQKMSPYKVKISDKEGNIITIEDDDGLYACVKLSFDPNSGILKLLDVAHEDSVLAEVEMPNADYIYNCRFDEELNAILFDVKSLYGDKTDTIELDVESLVELYEAGKGIEIGEKNEQTGRKPISIKLAEGEELLQLTDSGLGLDEKVITEEELETAISGKADISYVDEKIESIIGMSGDINTIIDKIEAIEDVIGTDIDDPNLDERIDSKADLDEFNDLEDEVGEIEADINELSGNVNNLIETVEAIDEKVSANTESINELSDKVDINAENISDLSDKIDLDESLIETLSGKIEDNKVYIEKISDGLPETVKEAYILKNTLGEQLGSRIDIYKNSSIENIEFESTPEGQFLIITYINSEGETEVTRIDLSEIIVETEFGDGIKVTSGVASVLIDPASDSYLSVSENGILLSGVASFMAALAETDAQQWTTINQNRIDLEEVDTQQWTAINANKSDLQSQIDIEKETRENADNRLSNALTAETAARIAADAEIAGGIDGKIEGERSRAIAAETDLRDAINAEKNRAIGRENEIESAINDEIENRENADNELRQDFNDSINNLSGRISGFEEAIATEREARIAADEELEESINGIREEYAKKEYVDTKDAETLETAINTSINSAKTYTDEEIDKLDRELKEYCDTGHTELQEAISDNSTKINAISNLVGVVGDDTSHYVDSGNGILDVLHREFHELEAEIGYLDNPTLQKNNKYEVAFGEYNISNTGESDAEKTMFSIGNGTSDDNRSNASEIRKDGTVYMWIEGEFMPINNLLGMLAHETY